MTDYLQFLPYMNPWVRDFWAQHKEEFKRLFPIWKECNLNGVYPTEVKNYEGQRVEVCYVMDPYVSPYFRDILNKEGVGVLEDVQDFQVYRFSANFLRSTDYSGLFRFDSGVGFSVDNRNCGFSWRILK